jgi:hypothetical protein
MRNGKIISLPVANKTKGTIYYRLDPTQPGWSKTSKFTRIYPAKFEKNMFLKKGTTFFPTPTSNKRKYGIKADGMGVGLWLADGPSGKPVTFPLLKAAKEYASNVKAVYEQKGNQTYWTASITPQEAMAKTQAKKPRGKMESFNDFVKKVDQIGSYTDFVKVYEDLATVYIYKKEKKQNTDVLESRLYLLVQRHPTLAKRYGMRDLAVVEPKEVKKAAKKKSSKTPSKPEDYKLKTLNTGVEVLARPDGQHYGYANRTQAQKRADKVDGYVWNRGGQVFYVIPPWSKSYNPKNKSFNWQEQMKPDKPYKKEKGKLEKVFWPDINKLDSLEEYLEESLRLPPKRRAEIKKAKTLVTEEKKLTTEAFDKLTRSFLSSRKWLEKTGGSSAEYEHMAVKVTAPNREPIYIDAQGYDYARYVGFPISTMNLLWALEADAKKSKTSKAKPKTEKAVASKGLTAAKKKEIKARSKNLAKDLSTLKRFKTRTQLLITQAQAAKLIENHYLNLEARKDNGHTIPFQPVVRIFNPSGKGTFYLSEYDPNQKAFFGFGGFEKGSGELGYNSLEDFIKPLPPYGLSFERDKYWTPKETVVEMAQKETYNQSYI